MNSAKLKPLFFGGLIAFVSSQAAHAENVLIVGADDDLTSIASQLSGFSTVDTFNSENGTPTLAQLDSYGAVLAFSNFTPQNSAALGDVLAQYANDGGRVVLATYALSNPWGITGQMMTPGYSPLVNVGVNGDVSGNIVPADPSNPIWNNVNPSAITFYHNGSYAHPALDPGATLLATDGAGNDMLAENAAGDIFALNAFPSTDPGFAANGQYWGLMDNLLGGQAPSSVPDGGCTLALFSLGLAGLGAIRRKLS